MNLKTTLLAATLAMFAASTAWAAEDAMTRKADTPTAEKAEAKKPLMKHSHSAERSGGMPTPQAASGKNHGKTMDKDTRRHDHTKDRH